MQLFSLIPTWPKRAFWIQFSKHICSEKIIIIIINELVTSEIPLIIPRLLSIRPSIYFSAYLWHVILLYFISLYMFLGLQNRTFARLLSLWYWATIGRPTNQPQSCRGLSQPFWGGILSPTWAFIQILPKPSRAGWTDRQKPNVQSHGGAIFRRHPRGITLVGSVRGPSVPSEGLSHLFSLVTPSTGAVVLTRVCCNLTSVTLWSDQCHCIVSFSNKTKTRIKWFCIRIQRLRTGDLQANAIAAHIFKHYRAFSTGHLGLTCKHWPSLCSIPLPQGSTALPPSPPTICNPWILVRSKLWVVG